MNKILKIILVLILIMLLIIGLYFMFDYIKHKDDCCSCCKGNNCCNSKKYDMNDTELCVVVEGCCRCD